MQPCLRTRVLALRVPLRAAVCQSKLLPPTTLTGTGTIDPLRDLHICCRKNRRSTSSPIRNRNPGLMIVRGLSEKSKKISESTILLQEGTQFQEVPMAILKSNACEGLENETTSKGPPKPYIELDPKEEAAFVEAFNNYHTPQEVLTILDTIPSQEVTPYVSFSILKKLFELESNFGFRNEGRSWVITSPNGKQETFARAAIIGRLMDIIMSTDNTSLLLDTLDVLRSEKSQLFYHDSDEFMNYRNRLCECILVKVTEGKLSLLETCRAVCAFGQMTSDKNFQIDNKFVDKLWVGILDKSNEITADNIVHVFRTVQYFTKCQRLVCGLVEKNMKTLWWRMDSETAAQICEIIGTEKKANDRWIWCIPGQLYSLLSKSTSLNMHQIQEGQLLKIIKCFYCHDFCDQVFRKALNKYVKAKWMKITKPELVCAISDYAKKFRLHTPTMLEGIADYVISQEGKGLSPPVITSIITCFGHVNFQPRNGIEFWNIMEKLIDEKFVQFTPNDLINILLSCTYLQKYPLNFVGRIFSPYFLDRVHSSENNFSDLQHLRSRLKLLDTSLHIECNPKYAGPILPKDHFVKNLLHDGRVARAASAIAESTPVSKLCRDNWTVQTKVILPTLPLNELYVADVLLLPLRGSEIQVQNYLRSRISRDNLPQQQYVQNDLICFLLRVPEHYTSAGNLTGPQAMRKRQLEKLGFKVAEFKCDLILELTRDAESFAETISSTLNSLGCSDVF